MSKYKRAVSELSEAEQRSEAAEAALQKQRQRTRAVSELFLSKTKYAKDYLLLFCIFLAE